MLDADFTFHLNSAAALVGLPDALDRSFAEGKVVRFEVFAGDRSLWTTDFAVNGWRATSGGQVITVLGERPDSFVALCALQEVVLRVQDFAKASPEAQEAWLTEMVAQGMTALSLQDRGEAAFRSREGWPRFGWAITGSW